MMQDNTLLITIITSIVSIICGGGGVLAFINAKQKNAHDDRASSVSEWKQLYDEMKKRLDEQEEENRKLRDELTELRSHIIDLKSELDRYKRYDKYMYELESYIDTVLPIVKSLSTDESYRTLIKKRPVKPQSLMKEEGE